ncbi:MAG: putative toxin-antitoxin system toxin component, PIN family [Chloroflexi bacterium]|nr:putative toxin-antitoxin system toxin component, PIN family [Chloroflexota bacterium]
MTPMRVVIDINVILSALLYRTRSLAWLRPLWQAGVIVPLVSRDTIAELHRVLLYDGFGLSDDDRREVLKLYQPKCEAVTISQPPPVPECRDPSDRPFLELALAGRANALVTGDQDLLALAPCSQFPSSLQANSEN